MIGSWSAEGINSDHTYRQPTRKKKMDKFIIITTINDKTRAISDFASLKDWQVVLVGDKKTPVIDESANLTYLSVERQNDMDFRLIDSLPFNHYCRKNIGYLYAMSQGAEVIYDTDDDNYPYPDWGLEAFECERTISGEQKYFNVYSYFTDSNIWPRGFPLNQIRRQNAVKIAAPGVHAVGVWQSLADIDPDVDALYRLIIGKNITFEKHRSIFLPNGTYCPFNSQNTFWRKELFPLLYLPCTVSFRFTDILRGYIAQRIMWEMDFHLGFSRAMVYQERNEHDFMQDLRDEVESYLVIEDIVKLLDNQNLAEDAGGNLLATYRALSDRKYVSERELTTIEAWIDDIRSIL